MIRNMQRVPSVLTQAWVAAACVGLAGSAIGYGFHMGEVVVATGYRQDSSSFSICSGLASPNYYGYGKAKSRDVHIWEIGIGASASLNDHLYLRSALSYGAILGGKLYDSGIADINSNPLNSVFGGLYTECCAPCNCDDNSCACDCQDKTFHPSVQTKANLRGNVVDFNVALGYAFRPCDDWMIAPVVGWTYNSQRQRWVDAFYGPLYHLGQFTPCYDDVTQNIGVSTVANPEPISYTYTDPATEQQVNVLGTATLGCVSFGDCFDGTVYRARWNGPFVGIDLGWAVSDVWNVVVGYAFSYNHLQVKFNTVTSEDQQGCACNLCPEFGYTILEDGSAQGSYQILGSAQWGGYSFVPSEMRFGSWGIGQEVSLATDYRCGNWIAGLGVSYTYKTATQCADSDPCTSCYDSRNPEQLPENFVASTVPGKNVQRPIRPVWSYAQLDKARWGSFSALVTLGYQF